MSNMISALISARTLRKVALAALLLGTTAYAAPALAHVASGATAWQITETNAGEGTYFHTAEADGSAGEGTFFHTA